MARIRTDILRILYYITLLIIMACAIGEDEANTTDEKSKVVVFRSSARGPDKVEICPTKSGEESHLRSIERKSMLCSETNGTSCSRLGGETCTCRQSSPNYVISQKKCVSNEWLRQGMSGHFGYIISKNYKLEISQTRNVCLHSGNIAKKQHFLVRLPSGNRRLGNNVSWFVHLQKTWLGNIVFWFAHLQKTLLGNNVFSGLSTFRKHG